MTNPNEDTNTATATVPQATTTLFGGSAPIITPSTTTADGAKSGGGEEDSGTKPDEDCSKEYEPVVQLAEVETKTGEEDEDVLFKIRAKLFRFSKELGEWKERGTGDVRVLKHRENEKVRLLMRREKTLKICLNHYVNPTVELSENVGSDRSWVWHGVDYADDEADAALLAIRFRDSENANLFKKAYDDAREHMRKLLGGADDSEEKEKNTDEKEKDDDGEQEDKKEEKAADEKDEKDDA